MVQLKSAIAERDGREVSPTPDQPDPDNVMAPNKKAGAAGAAGVDDIMATLQQHMEKAQKQQADLMKPKNEKESYGSYVQTWLSGLDDDEFDTARTEINELIVETSRARRRVAKATA
jgi:hypothetical protein